MKKMKPDLDIEGMCLHEEKIVDADNCGWYEHYTIIRVFTGWIYDFGEYAVFVPENK